MRAIVYFRFGRRDIPRGWNYGPKKSREDEAQPHDVHNASAARAGARLQEDSLPRHLHEGKTRRKNQIAGVKNTGL